MKVGFDIQFALTRARTGLYNHMTGLVGGLQRFPHTSVMLLACQRRVGAYGREDVAWASAAFGGLRVVLEHPPSVLYRVWHHMAAHSRVDVLVHNLHGVIPAISRGANVFIVPDVIPLTMNSGHPGYADECLDFYRRAVRTGDAVVVSSADTKRELVAATGGDPVSIHVVPIAVGPEFRALSRDECRPLVPQGLADIPYILCVSTIEPRKNHEVLLRAYARLIAQHPELPHQLVLVGGTREGFAAPLLLMRSLGLEHRVRHLGFVESLPALYSAADLFVFPSVYEGFGLPPLEAMSCGTPVLCSNASSLPEVVGSAGLMFDPADSDMLCELMRRVLMEPALRRTLSEQSLRRASQFSWHKTADQFLGVLHSAVAQRAAGGPGAVGAATPVQAHHARGPRVPQ